MYHPTEVSKWLNKNDIAPIYVEIGPINLCNHNCNFCGLDFIERDTSKLDKEKLIRNLKDMAELGVKSIMFSGSGEPLLYHGIEEVVEKAKMFGLDISFTTNGVLLNLKRAKALLENCSWIKVSIDAGTAKTHSLIHGCSEDDFNKILDNLKSAVEYKQENNLDCTIGTQALLIKDNIDEIEELIIKLKEIGVDYLVLKPYSKHPDSINEHYIDLSDYDGELIDMVKKHSNDSFKVIYRSTAADDIHYKDIGYDKCYGLDFFAIIDAKGNLIPCHIFHEKKEYAYGNINEQLFSDIWKSQKRKEILNQLHGKGCSDCRKGCRMHQVNKYLDNLTNKKIKHVNFI